jgi:hypothetical protein
VRVRIDLDEWQPLEDGPFIDGSHMLATFEFLREVKQRTPDILVAASVWKVADWMVSNPESEEHRSLQQEKYAKVVDAMGAWLVRAKEEYGVEVDYVSFNEADIGITVSLTPSEVVALIREGGPRLESLGLKTRWLLGDTSSAGSFTAYTPRIYAEEDIRPYLGPLAFHSWDASTPDLFLRNIGEFADANGLEVWCTEGGFDAQEWNTPEEFPTWKHAQRLAGIYTRVLRETRATTLLYW